MRNISWLASCFSRIKKPNKYCSGNQSVIDITSRTISRQNQKPNTTPQLYCTLSYKYVKPKPISRQNQKLTQQHNWKKVPPAHAQQVYSFLCHSVCLEGLREGYGVKEC
jgi:hypothetical protein